MVILGVDPGIAITGYGIVRYVGSSFRPLGFGCIRTEAKEHEADRLRTIHERLHELVEAYSPQAVAVEKLFFNRNVQSALSVGQARGVALLAAAHHRVPVYEYTPSAVKMGVTGQGRAPKSQVAYMVKVLLALDEAPTPDDVSDALAVALCHAFHGQTQQRQQQAMEGGAQ